MLVSENWLRQLANPDLDLAGLAHRLTMAGLEVDNIEALAALSEQIVVGRIISITPHADSKKLNICEVSTGGDHTLTVVCGAGNARAGLNTAFAQIGATLPNGMIIGKAVIQGVESSGMLCSEKELGLSDDHGGIMELSEAAPGATLNEVLGLPDNIIDIDLTPNRGDCLSMNGIARELASLTGCELSLADTPKTTGGIPDQNRNVILEAPALCPRYVGRVIRNIPGDAATPIWMTQKLNRGGMRSVGNLIVDVTNYVQLESGQPMHAFDLDKLQGDLRVHQCGETVNFIGIDQSEYTLEPDTLVVADGSGPIAVAGVIGGSSTSVGAGTSNILLESACFTPDAVAGRARKLGLHTESSHRFERGVDPMGQSKAIERATELILSIAGGEAGIPFEQMDESFLKPNPVIDIQHKRVNKLLGIEISTDCINDIFRRIYFDSESSEQGWKITAPSWRSDIRLECDVIEEIIRVHGYENIPTRIAHGRIGISVPPDALISEGKYREHLAGMGFSEAVTYSFVDPALQKILSPSVPAIAITNPLASDISVMRTSLLPGLVAAYTRNLKRQAQNIRLFEIGHVFRLHDKGAVEVRRIAGIAGGAAAPVGWSSPPREMDFFDVKGYIMSLLQPTNNIDKYGFHITDNPILHPGQGADVLCNGSVIGYLGRLHPALGGKLDVNSPAFVFELDLDHIEEREIACFKPLSQYPSSKRDLAVIVDETVTSAKIRELILQTSGKLLTNLELFDVYRGNNIDSGRKSLGFSLTFQGLSRTLKDTEIDDSMNAVISALQNKLGAEIRR